MTTLAHSCHVAIIIITTKFGEFLHNHLGGDSVTDRLTYRADYNLQGIKAQEEAIQPIMPVPHQHQIQSIR